MVVKTDAAPGTFLSLFYRRGQRAPAGAGFISNSAGRFGEVWRTWCEGERGEGDEKSGGEIQTEMSWLG